MIFEKNATIDRELVPKSRVTATKKRLKIMITGAKTQPCLTPARTSNGSDSWPDNLGCHSIMKLLKNGQKV